MADYKNVFGEVSLVDRIKRVYGKGGIFFLLFSMARYVYIRTRDSFLHVLYKLLPAGSFEADGVKYKYFSR